MIVNTAVSFSFINLQTQKLRQCVRKVVLKRPVKVCDVTLLSAEEVTLILLQVAEGGLALTRPFRLQGKGDQSTGSRATPLPWGILHCFHF
jgi:hypothetical protein